MATTTAPPKLRIGIVLSGWAPAMTLMSGVMRGFIEEKIEFDVVSTSGIGAFVGLLYLAPRGGKPDHALRELPNLFVSDLLHAFVPLNFKMFYKNGPFAQMWYELREQIRKIPVDPDSASPAARFINDSMDLAATALTPPSLESYRKALMSQVSMLEERVDFAALRALAPTRRFYLNAFDLSGQAQQVFDSSHVGNQYVAADAFRAAQAMFLLFPPERVRGGLFTTGATHDPTGLQAIWLKERKRLDMVIALDPMGPAIWRSPVNIHDAFQLMLLNPIVALQVLMLGLYAKTESQINPVNPERKLPPLYRIPFDVAPCRIPPSYYPQMLEWTHDNAVTLERIGYCAAREFAQTLRLRPFAEFDARYRYANRLDVRSEQFLDTHLSEPQFWPRSARADREKYAPGRSRTSEESS